MFAETVGNAWLDEIGRAHVHRSVFARLKDVSPATLNKNVRTLRAAFARAAWPWEAWGDREEVRRRWRSDFLAMKDTAG